MRAEEPRGFLIFQQANLWVGHMVVARLQEQQEATGKEQALFKFLLVMCFLYCPPESKYEAHPRVSVQAGVPRGQGSSEMWTSQPRLA